MDCQIRKKGEVLICDISGNLYFNNMQEFHAIGKLREKIRNEIKKDDTKKVLFNLSQVTMIDSAGVGFLVSTYKSFMSKSKDSGSVTPGFALINPTKEVENILRTVGLLNVLLVFKTEKEALEKFSK